MNYYVTLVGRPTFRIAGVRFVKGTELKVSERIYNIAMLTADFKGREVPSANDYAVKPLDLTGRPTIIYPRTVDYDILQQRPQHMMKAFAAAGYNALYIDFSGKEPIREIAPRFYVLSGDVPVKLGKPTVLYWSFPKHIKLVDTYKPDYLLFDSIDAPEGPFHHWKEGYVESLEKADMVLASAEALYDAAKKHNTNVLLVPNAVDYNKFVKAQVRQVPDGLKLDGRPVVGFYGAFGVWVDTELMSKTVDAMPDFQFIFIGPSHGNPVKNDKAIVLDHLPYDKLVPYLSVFDVGIIPFKEGQVSVSCNPLKMWEYMAAGKPFVTTNLPEATYSLQATKDNFVDKIREAYKDRASYKKILPPVAQENNWDSRAALVTQHMPITIPGMGYLSAPELHEDTMYIAIAVSPNWATHVRKLVFSIFTHCKGPIKIILLSDCLIDTRDICDLYGKGYDCITVNVSDLFNLRMANCKNIESRYTKYTLYRLLLPELLHTVDKILYLDADILVVGDLYPLYRTHVEHVAGVEDSGAIEHREELGLTKYINAGVTLMNLNNIREQAIDRKWMAMVNYKKYRFNDQDIINMTCKVDYVKPIWNSSVSTQLIEQPRVMHFAGVKPWSGSFISSAWRENEIRFNNFKLANIPRIIHYCWFGGNKKTELVDKCISSWRKYDFRIIEWNETNFDVNSNPYVKEAYDKGKWAFVTDYVRLHALNLFGGIYMDSDYELLKPIDKFLQHRAFTGHETTDIPVTAIMGAEPEHPWIKTLLKYYDTAKFEEVPNTVFISKLMKNMFVEHTDKYSIYTDGLVVYTVETFCPFDHKKLQVLPTENTYGVHHFSGSWTKRASK
jgi:lipopolysaccharide biosynthesis glycosyltransferase